MTEEAKKKIWPFNGYAPGNYMNTCATCGKDMCSVDKLCFTCLECAISDAKRRVSELEAWKESTMQVMNEINLQECAKVLGVPLGQSIADKILPALKQKA